MSRSDIFCTNSKWSRFARSTQITSSKSSSSQVSGVSRRWARPGEQTSTRRSLPASDQTPTLGSVVSMSIPLSWSRADRSGQTETNPWTRPTTATTERIATTPTRTFSTAVNTTCLVSLRAHTNSAVPTR